LELTHTDIDPVSPTKASVLLSKSAATTQPSQKKLPDELMVNAPLASEITGVATGGHRTTGHGALIAAGRCGGQSCLSGGGLLMWSDTQTGTELSSRRKPEFGFIKSARDGVSGCAIDAGETPEMMLCPISEQQTKPKRLLIVTKWLRTMPRGRISANSILKKQESPSEKRINFASKSATRKLREISPNVRSADVGSLKAVTRRKEWKLRNREVADRREELDDERKPAIGEEAEVDGRKIVPRKHEVVNSRLLLGQNNQVVAIEEDRIGPLVREPEE
jgi:hypothetical protein